MFRLGDQVVLRGGRFFCPRRGYINEPDNGPFSIDRIYRTAESKPYHWRLSASSNTPRGVDHVTKVDAIFSAFEPA